jgi:hypothetical protein
VDLFSRTVTAPGGETWAVSPRWNLTESPVRLPSAWRRGKDQEGDSRFADWLDPSVMIGDDLVGALVFFVIMLVVGLLAWFVIWPLLAIAIEVLIGLLLVGASILARLVLRRPWIVEAKGNNGGRLEYAVRGYGAMRRVLSELASQLQLGNTRPQVPGAVELLPHAD